MSDERDATSSQRTDEALLAAVRSGDEQAVAELVERHAPSVLRFGVQLCGDEQQARDVMQETLLAAARGLRAYRGESRLTTWLYTIARTFCTKLRTRGDAGKHLQSLEELGEDGFEAALAVEQQRPDAQAAQLELQRAVTRAIRELEPAQREVLVLRDVEGLSAAEVATVLDVSVQAVKSRLHRARAALRERLLPMLAEPG
jgi:RNA polymerase sigma-70 factor (ECF subfamily)